MPRLGQMMATALVAGGVPGAGLAEDSAASGPVTTEFVFELQTDHVFDADAPGDEITDTFATIEGAIGLALGAQTSLNATLLIEPVTDPVDDRFLEDHGFYAEELFLSHDFGAAEVILGKFNPAFGVAWDVAPGIYGVDFAENYEIAEQLGAAVNIPLMAGSSGDHMLQVAVFRADRTFLSDSLGKSRGPLKRADGGVTNTSGLESFSLAIAGEIGATAYNAGYQHLGKGLGDVADQQGIVAGLSHGFGGGGSGPVEVLAEVAWFDDFDGAGSGATFATLGVAAPVGPVTLSGVYSLRDVAGAPTDSLATVSAEMELAEGLTGGLAYRFGDEGGGESQTLGALLVYEF